jgi:L-iditol 2-dehydrogenase
MYYNNRDVRLVEMPIPKIHSGEILVKIMASGICGSDLMEWYRIKRAPLILGHEVTGEIVEVGEGVEQYGVGDRVFVSHHVPCNTCHYCLSGHQTVCETLQSTNFDPGGFAEFVRVPKINVDRGLYLLPEEMSFEDGTFIEPLACALRGQRLAGVRQADSVLVMGCGVSGLLHVQSALASGAGRIIVTDVNEFRLRAAMKLGADATIHAEEDVQTLFRQANKNRLADRVIVCTGAISAFTQALHSVERGGTVLFFAPTEPNICIPLPINDFWRKEITVMTSYGASPANISTALELIRAKRVRVNDMITHRLSLEEAGLGFRIAAEAKESIKVIIEPNR